MGSRDHAVTCKVCGFERGGLNDLLCGCEQEWVQTLRDPDLSEINRLQAQRDQFATAIDRMKPVYDAAVAWRDTWRHRHPLGEEAKAVALVDAVDGALAKATTSVACPGCECWTPESHAAFCPARAS